MWIQTQNEEAAAGTPAADPAAAAATAPAEPVAAPATPAAGEVAAAVVDPTAPLVAPPPGETDWLPEKFRVNDAEGKLDEAASARKLAESYKALEAHKGPLPPKTPEDYAPEGLPEGINFDEIKADPLYQGFLKGAHAKGMSNDQVSYALNEYLKLAPQIGEANKELTAAEARADLQRLWPEDADLNKHLASVQRAIQGFGGEADDMPGSRARLFDKFGSDPDFIAFAAAVAGEMAEDKLPIAGLSTATDVEALMKSKAYMDPNDPAHAATVAKVKAHFDRTYGTGKR